MNFRGEILQFSKCCKLIVFASFDLKFCTTCPDAYEISWKKFGVNLVMDFWVCKLGGTTTICCHNYTKKPNKKTSIDDNFIEMKGISNV